MAARYYTKIDDKTVKLPSVTTIIGVLDKPALVYWAAGCACDYILENTGTMPLDHGSPTEVVLWDELQDTIEHARKEFRNVSKKALDIGSAVHAAVEEWLKSGIEPESPSEGELSGFIAFLEWYDAHHVKTIKTEHTLYADKYAGTTDLICELDGKRYLVDFKTTKKPKAKMGYAEWGYQTAAYRACYPDLEGNGILRLDKSTGYPDFYDLSDGYEHDLKVFSVLTDLYYLTHKF